jgi:hypothetical protein
VARGADGASGAVGGRAAASDAGAIPHRSADAAEAGGAETLAVAAGRGVAPFGGGRGPLVRTRIAAPSKATSTVPSVSVR